MRINHWWILKTKPTWNKKTISSINNWQIFFILNLRDTRVKVVFPFPKSGLLCKEIITLRLLPHVIKGHTFSYRPSSHLKDLIQQTWNNHYYHRRKRFSTVSNETNQIIVETSCDSQTQSKIRGISFISKCLRVDSNPEASHRQHTHLKWMSWSSMWAVH